MIHAGRHAGYYSPSVEWGPEEEAKLMHDVDALYVDFVQKMATARAKPFDAFEQLAQGRVWTGSQALENGLVDSSGGLSEAIVHLRRALSLGDQAPLRFASMARGGALRALFERFNPAGRVGLGGLSALASWSELGEELAVESAAGATELLRLRLPFDIRFK